MCDSCVEVEERIRKRDAALLQLSCACVGVGGRGVEGGTGRAVLIVKRTPRRSQLDAAHSYCK